MHWHEYDMSCYATLQDDAKFVEQQKDQKQSVDLIKKPSCLKTCENKKQDFDSLKDAEKLRRCSQSSLAPLVSRYPPPPPKKRKRIVTLKFRFEGKTVTYISYSKEIYNARVEKCFTLKILYTKCRLPSETVLFSLKSKEANE